jgi:hypothetical protein
MPKWRSTPPSKLDEFSCSSENMGFAKDSGRVNPKREESTVCEQPPAQDLAVKAPTHFSPFGSWVDGSSARDVPGLRRQGKGS